ncbi:hypothetical protein [Francisella tularensis]|uniref:hypothetical protein n=1 Tax=Francisella tularensis TaxID=263 RepID=UPI001C1FE493|nr:hypothetical protein [Francisella tularensis]
MKKFDLNIEKILENWEMHHAIREIIANAIDESILSKTQGVQIFKENSTWIIRDYGRGLKHTHLTQNENYEKLNHNEVIGKFGIGLKDALATFYRKSAKITILSKYNLISVEVSAKEGFQDILTLHAIIKETSDANFIGTEFRLDGITDDEMYSAKKLFLKFSDEKILEDTPRGQIIDKAGEIGNIYINGVKVAEEKNFLFSYNITLLTAPIKKALNRERTNVGRSAYTESVKKILLSSSHSDVIKKLAHDLQNINLGTAHDELAWIDVQEHAVKILNETVKSVFITSYEAMQDPDMIDEARRSGYNIVIIPENLKYKINNSKDLSGNPIMDIGEFVKNYNDNFEFDFITENDMSNTEKNIFSMTNSIITLFGGLPKNVKDIKVSNTMRKNFDCYNEAGLWCPSTGLIIISRKTLSSLREYSGVLIHELVHAKTGYTDVTRDFETALTSEIGKLSEKLFLEYNKNNDDTCTKIEEIMLELEHKEKSILSLNKQIDDLKNEKEFKNHRYNKQPKFIKKAWYKFW